MATAYGVPGEGERGAWAEVVAEAFGLLPAEMLAIGERVGVENTRVFRANGGVAAALTVFGNGLSLGGRLVPNAAVASVGVRPELRRRGYASRLMAGVVAEARDTGQYVSTLYASNQPLYRRAGYEQAGVAFRASVSVPAIGLSEHDLVVRRIGPADEPVVEAMYRARVHETPGFMDRHPYQWDRIRRPRVGPASLGLGVEEEGRLVGWMYVRQVAGTGGPWGSLQVVDVHFEHARAARNLWSTLADMGTMARTVNFESAPQDPFYQVLPHPFVDLTLFENWMLRINDLRALEARGYAAGLRGAVELDIEDPAGHCQGRHVLEVEDGEGRVRPGGRGLVRVHIRGLASLYTGFASARQIELVGLGEGLAPLAALFAGPMPWTRDRY